MAALPTAEHGTTSATAPEHPRAVFALMDRLRIRSDFLRVARGRRVATDAFILQAAPRAPETEDRVPFEVIRVGFTCSRKVGNAVARNRAKRRLREIARLVLPLYGALGFDYVLIGRAERTARHDFDRMQDDLRDALLKLHGSDRT